MYLIKSNSNFYKVLYITHCCFLLRREVQRNQNLNTYKIYKSFSSTYQQSKLKYRPHLGV